eukprot:CAMPEP_0118650244 /NCGR_PEP_ID=MMETSP0785-20121206/10142_1 /TAXON_ID=91992 /ORGANISM="Bolidomonas pacifica, Strain CCMP 1866" /LENGTH=101 /DNA_ID=CAMNT_0006542603 /DNA_START=477 /DNA_END=783 /DNA_ORIENTATION=-
MESAGLAKLALGQPSVQFSHVQALQNNHLLAVLAGHACCEFCSVRSTFAPTDPYAACPWDKHVIQCILYAARVRVVTVQAKLGRCEPLVSKCVAPSVEWEV